MSQSSQKNEDVSFEKNQFTLVTDSIMNSKEVNDFDYNDCSYKNMISSLELKHKEILFNFLFF